MLTNIMNNRLRACGCTASLRFHFIIYCSWMPQPLRFLFGIRWIWMFIKLLVKMWFYFAPWQNKLANFTARWIYWLGCAIPRSTIPRVHYSQGPLFSASAIPRIHTAVHHSKLCIRKTWYTSIRLVIVVMVFQNYPSYGATVRWLHE